MSTVSPTAPFEGELIREPTPCGKCGYDLRGLRVGTRCPECGQPVADGAVAAARREPEQFGRPLVEAPDWYLRSLQVAFTMMTLAWIPMPIVMTLEFFGFNPLGSLSRFLVWCVLACCWAGGVLITLQPRPSSVRGKRGGVPIREHPNLRLIVGLMQIPVVLIPITVWIASTGGGTSMGYVNFALILMALGGYTPTALYFAKIAEWARDEGLSEKLRAYGWLSGIGLAGSIFVILSLEFATFLPVLPVISGFFWLFALVILFLSVILLTISTIRLMSMSRWLVINRHALLDRDARMIEKAHRQAAEMAARHPTAPPQENYDQALYDSVIEKHKKSQAETQEPASTTEDVKYSSDQRMEKTGDNPYGLEEDES